MTSESTCLYVNMFHFATVGSVLAAMGWCGCTTLHKSLPGRLGLCTAPCKVQSTGDLPIAAVQETAARYVPWKR